MISRGLSGDRESNGLAGQFSGGLPLLPAFPLSVIRMWSPNPTAITHIAIRTTSLRFSTVKLGLMRMPLAASDFPLQIRKHSLLTRPRVYGGEAEAGIGYRPHGNLRSRPSGGPVAREIVQL